MMLYGFREREYILDIFEETSGLRMNHAYIRPGGVRRTSRLGGQEDPRLPRVHAEEAEGVRSDALRPGIWHERTQGRRSSSDRLPVAGHHRSGAALGRPGWDLRKTMPYAATSVRIRRPDATTADVWAASGPIAEIRESLKIVEQAWTGSSPPDHDRRQEDRRRRPARDGPGRPGNSLEHVAKIMGQSMESLIHHFKLVTEGFRVPPGQVYVAIESRAASSACTRSPTVARIRTGCICATEFREPPGHPRDGRRCAGWPTSSPVARP